MDKFAKARAVSHATKDLPCGVNNQLPDALYNDSDTNIRLQKEKPIHRLVIFMASAGFSHVEISEKVGLKPDRVSYILRQPWARIKLLETQRQVATDGLKELLAPAATAAFKRLEGLAESATSESVKADANKYLVNRYLGAPTQPIAQTKVASDMSDEELRQSLGGLLSESNTNSESVAEEPQHVRD